MAQATADVPPPADLPEPVEPVPASDSSSASADDLLSELAGAEIDRLLAEADARPAEVSASDTGAADPQAGPVAGEQPADEAQLESRLNELSAEAKPAQPAISSAGPEPQPAQQPLEVPVPEVQTTSAERSALTEAENSLSPQLRPEPSPGASTASAAPAELPLYLRPLAWLNAPLDLFPDFVRDLIGKIAILTLLNAAGVLLYLLLFRHHR